MIRLISTPPMGAGIHRDGWPAVLSALGEIESPTGMLVDDYVADVMKKSREAIILQIEVTADHEKAAALLQQLTEVAKVEMVGKRIDVTLKKGIEDYSSIPSAIIERGFKLKLFREEELNLETAFMMLTKGKQQ